MTDTATSPAESNEEFIRGLLDLPDTVDALWWLKCGTDDEPRTLAGCLTLEESIAHIHEILERGAKSVLACPTGSAAYPVRPSLLIELPADPEVRQRLYDWNVATAWKFDTDATGSMGATHMFHLVECLAEDLDFDDDDDDDDDEYDDE